MRSRPQPARSALRPSRSKIRQAADIAAAFEALKDRAEALYFVGDLLTAANQVSDQ